MDIKLVTLRQPPGQQAQIVEHIEGKDHVVFEGGRVRAKALLKQWRDSRHKGVAVFNEKKARNGQKPTSVRIY